MVKLISRVLVEVVQYSVDDMNYLINKMTLLSIYYWQRNLFKWCCIQFQNLTLSLPSVIKPVKE